MRVIFISEHVLGNNLLRTLVKKEPDDVIVRVPLVFTDSPEGVIEDMDDVVAVGSSRVVDYAKLCSSISGSRLTAIPTEITTDALFTSDTAIREDGWVKYVKSKRPDVISLNEQVLLSNKNRCNYGWLDVLSSLSAKTNSLPHPGMAKLCRMTEPVTDMSSIYKLLYCLKREVEICEEVGTALLIEEGIEHYMSYVLENHIPRRLMHGEYLALAMKWLIEEEEKAILDTMHTQSRGFPPASITLKDLKYYLTLLGIYPDSYESYGVTERDMDNIHEFALKMLERDVKKVKKR